MNDQLVSGPVFNLNPKGLKGFQRRQASLRARNSPDIRDLPSAREANMIDRWEIDLSPRHNEFATQNLPRGQQSWCQYESFNPPFYLLRLCHSEVSRPRFVISIQPADQNGPAIRESHREAALI